MTQSLTKTSGGALVGAPTARRQGELRHKLRKAWPAYLFILPTFVFIILFRYYPAFSAIYHAFTKWNGAGMVEWVGLANFQQMLGDTVLHRSLGNVAILTIARVIQGVIFPLIVAELLFNLRSLRAQYWYRFLLTVPIVVPGLVIILVWKWILNPAPFGVINNALEALGLASWQRAWLADPNIALLSVIFAGFPWVGAIPVLIYYAGLQNISSEIVDASLIDGASVFRRILSIDVPLISGQIKAWIIMTTIWTLQGFDSILALTGGGPGASTMVPGLWMYRRAFEGDLFGYAAAIGVLLFVIMGGLTFINSQFVKGAESAD